MRVTAWSAFLRTYNNDLGVNASNRSASISTSTCLRIYDMSSCPWTFCMGIVLDNIILYTMSIHPYVVESTGFSTAVWRKRFVFTPHIHGDSTPCYLLPSFSWKWRFCGLEATKDRSRWWPFKTSTAFKAFRKSDSSWGFIQLWFGRVSYSALGTRPLPISNLLMDITKTQMAAWRNPDGNCADSALTWLSRDIPSRIENHRIVPLRKPHIIAYG